MPNKTKELIKLHEGYNNVIYKDSFGNLTCGWGHYLEEGSKVPKEVSRIFFKSDFNNAVKIYESYQFNLDPVREAVIINMIFNLGASKFDKFKRLIKALRLKDFTWAAAEMRDSLWYTQVRTRAEILEKIMLSGEFI